MLESSRVMKMKKKIPALALSTLLMLGGCGQKEAEPTLNRYSNMALDAGFDTVMTLTGFTETEEEFTQYFNTMRQEFLRYNALFDVYNNYDGLNNIKTINDNAGIQPVEVGDEIIDLLKTAREFYDLSDGEFDVTMGAVLQIWHQYREEGLELNSQGQPGRIPDQQQLEEAKACSGWDKVEIDEENNTVYLTDSCVSLDVGGIAKGYAAGKVAETLQQQGLQHATVDAGGNVCTINNKPGNENWIIGIRNPSGNGSIATLSLPTSSAFVSSGDYERYYIAEDGRQMHHIIDPQTLQPADYFHQVTIITADSGVADALSTSLFTMSYEDGLALVEQYNAQHPDQTVGVMWVMDKDRQPEGAEGFVQGDYFVTWTQNMNDTLVQ